MRLSQTSLYMKIWVNDDVGFRIRFTVTKDDM